jgi:amino acid adenylation domain-containing protein
MTGAVALQHLLDEAASRDPRAIAVEAIGGPAVSYGELVELSDRVRDRLVQMGVQRGDRVGICLGKSVDAIASIFGILKAGAAYVPVDPDAPAHRCAYIMSDCRVTAAITDANLELELKAAFAAAGAVPKLFVLPVDGTGLPLADALEIADRTDPAGTAPTVMSGPDELAYILYTSGSTGRPKGVMLTHRAAGCFIDWCSETFQPLPSDVYSSHAPLHFDLSIHDVFVPVKHGARLVLIGEQLGKDPISLAPVIAEKHITVWYSTPSILSLLSHRGHLDRFDFSALRLVLFAGEVFPVGALRHLVEQWSTPRYFNLYGPTETNVCTWFEVPCPIDEARVEPFPIGRMCRPLLGRVVDADGADVRPGEQGELLVAGPGVMSGYWNLPDLNADAFLIDSEGVRWYRTGDLVVEGDDGEYIFHGRRDRMVKRRGYRVELGEIEAGLARHAGVREVAVIAHTDGEAGVRIKAYIGVPDGVPLSVIALKQFCAASLPRYMVPDTFVFLDKLPRTSTDKIDYRGLE